MTKKEYQIIVKTLKEARRVALNSKSSQDFIQSEATIKCICYDLAEDLRDSNNIGDILTDVGY
jgi:hypothetical protein